MASKVTAKKTFGPGRAPVFVLARNTAELKAVLAVYALPDESERMVYVAVVNAAGDESQFLETAGAVVGVCPVVAGTTGKGAPHPATGWLYKLTGSTDTVAARFISYLDRWQPRNIYR